MKLIVRWLLLAAALLLVASVYSGVAVASFGSALLAAFVLGRLNTLVRPFSDAVQQLEIGKYTATPVKSEFGWHVIKLEETRATKPPPYDAVKAQIGPVVKQKKFEAHLKELVKAAKVERAL